MPKINVINNAVESLTIDPGASGDSFVQYKINTAAKFIIGVDDSDADKFKLSYGSALGTTDVHVITSAGETTKPLQPSFLATTNEYELDKTGDSSVYSVAYATEIFDQGGDYNGAGTLTAPISGRYRISANVLFNQLAAANTSGYMKIVTSNRTYRSCVMNYGAVRVTASGSANPGIISVLCDMDAADTAIIQVMISGATKIVDVGYTNRGLFSAELVC